jgi:hypothetical protein
VDELGDISTRRYAVISVRSEPHRERLVIAYPDERTLRALIAAPSIVALGYTSRADALKNIDCCVPSKPSLKGLLKMALSPNITSLTKCRLVLRRFAGSLGFSRPSGIMRSLLHDGVAVALIFFYSRNILSSTVRALISF